MKLRRHITFFLIITFTIIFSGCRTVPQKAEKTGADADVLAKVGDRKITFQEFRKKIDRIPKRHRNKITSKDKSRILDQMIESSLFAMEAGEMKLDQDEDVQTQIKNSTDRILFFAYYNKMIIPNINITDDDIKQYYESNPSRFKEAEKVRASQILLRLRPDAAKDKIMEVKNLAENLKKRLDNGEDFAELARKYSQDRGTKQKGGDMGFFSGKKKPAQVSKAAFALQPGQVSKPVKSVAGYHIIMVTGKKPEGIKSPDSVRNEIKTILTKEKGMELRKEKKGLLEKKYGVSINEKLLSTKIK